MCGNNYGLFSQGTGRNFELKPPTSKWLKLLYPRMYVPSVICIDPEDLYIRGIRCVLFDLDNTVVPRDETVPPPGVICWINRLKEKGIKICVVSNNGPGRIVRVSGMESVPAVCRAVKPRRQPFQKAMEMLGVRAEETAVVGDQIFTDIFGGNRLGLFTILVTPMPGREYWATELINRRLESFVIKRIKKEMNS